MQRSDENIKLKVRYYFVQLINVLRIRIIILF